MGRHRQSWLINRNQRNQPPPSSPLGRLVKVKECVRPAPPRGEAAFLSAQPRRGCCMTAVLVVRKVSLTCRLIVESAVERAWARMVGERGSRGRGCVEGARGPGAGDSVFSETQFRRWVFMSSGRAVKHVNLYTWSCQVVALPNLKKSGAPQALLSGAVRQFGGAESVLETIGSKSADCQQ